MSELHEDCYADKAQHKYPIHTKQATLQSYDQYLKDMQYLSDQRCDLINRNFVKAASLHGIKLHSPYPDADIPRQTIHFSDEDISIDMSKIASVQDMEDTLYQIQNHRDTLSMPLIRKIAVYTVDAGQSLDAPEHLMVQFQKLAGMGLGDKEQMLNQFLKRASLIMLPEDVKSKFYGVYNNMTSEDDLDMHKQASVCDMISGIDRLYGLTEHYNKQIKAPEQVCHCVTLDSLIKEASDYMRVPSTDTVLSKTALLQNKDTVCKFLKDKYEFESDKDQAILNKVASLSEYGIKALIQELEQ